jgi:hypothetical protein
MGDAMNNVIAMDLVLARRAHNVGVGAYLNAARLQLTPTQCSAWARKARRMLIETGKSPARVLSDVHAQLRTATTGGAA